MLNLKKLLMATLLLAPGIAAAKDQPSVIRFGIASVGTGNRPVFGGATASSVHLKGLLEEEFKADGIKIDWSYFKGAGPAVNEAVANRLLDFAWQGDLPSVIGRAGGLATKIIVPNGTRGQSYLIVPSDSKAQSIEDLKGRKVAVFKGTSMQLSVNRILASRNLSSRDFKEINMDGATGRAAIATKDVDGLWGSYELLQLVDQGIARVVYSTAGQSSELTRFTHIIVTEDFEKSYPEIVQRVVNVFVKESAWASDEKNRDKVFEGWAKSGFSYSVWKKDFEGALLSERNSVRFDEHFVQHYKDAVEGALKYQLIRKPFEVSGWLEPKYVENALQAQKLKDYWPEYDRAGQIVKKTSSH